MILPSVIKKKNTRNVCSTACTRFIPELELSQLSSKFLKIQYFDVAKHYYHFGSYSRKPLSQSKMSTEHDTKNTTFICKQISETW